MAEMRDKFTIIVFLITYIIIFLQLWIVIITEDTSEQSGYLFYHKLLDFSIVTGHSLIKIVRKVTEFFNSDFTSKNHIILMILDLTKIVLKC